MENSIIPLAEQLLQLVGHNVNLLSNDLIQSLDDVLVKTRCTLLSTHNERQLLFRLPNELLHKILEHVPEPLADRWTASKIFWRNTAMRSSMLVPVTHVCRRLRDCALSHPQLWKNINTNEPSLIPSLLQWSRPSPLSIVAVSRDYNLMSKAFDSFYPAEVSRVRELHLCRIEVQDADYVLNLVETLSLPVLESFSLECRSAWKWRWEGRTLAFSAKSTPRLQRLTLADARFLPQEGLPLLTHVALKDISMPDIHTKLIRFLSSCPRLESVALGGLGMDAVGDFPTNLPPASLNRLRHVTLHELKPKILECYLAFLQPQQLGSSYHILGYHAWDEDLAFRHLFPSRTELAGIRSKSDSGSGSGTRVCIALHPNNNNQFRDRWDALSITTSNGEYTRRVASYAAGLMMCGAVPWAWPKKVLESTHARLDVREVWMSGVGSGYPWARGNEMAACHSPLLSFPEVEAVVIVFDRTFDLADDAPGLHLLPSAKMASFNSYRLTTLRLAHGFDDFATAKKVAEFNSWVLPDVVDMKIGQLLEDMASGAYDYLEHLAIQVTPRVRVDQEELGLLRKHFKTMVFEVVDELPKMPIHSDPARWECERWHGGIW